MRLYEISDIYRNVINAVENEEVNYNDIKEALDVIEDDFDNKVDNTACLIKDMQGDVEKMKTEEKNLSQRRKFMEKRIDDLKQYLSYNLLAVGKRKLETSRNKISFRKSSALKIDDEKSFAAFYPEYCNVETVYKVDKNRVKQSIKNGEVIEGASVIESDNIQIK